MFSRIPGLEWGAKKFTTERWQRIKKATLNMFTFEAPFSCLFCSNIMLFINQCCVLT